MMISGRREKQVYFGVGLSMSCPLEEFENLDFDAIFVRSISFQDGDMRNPSRSFSFNGRDSEPALLKSYGPRRVIFERTVSFRGKEFETFSFKTPSADMENKLFERPVSSNTRDVRDGLLTYNESSHKNSQATSPEPDERSRAALKLQKVYKSFRTRRRLADCAVLVEQRWWKLLDFAELKRSSISFFDIEKPETAVSRWSRARTKAAKVGKGLSKDEKARKLALQHWLEAIDPRHRYGHNLQFYYVKWLHCDSKQPFFYWLDIGEGKEVNLERCPRQKLHQQCIKYLGPTERKAYEVLVENGKFLYRYSGKLLHTTGGPKDVKWIFVLSTSKTLYVGLKKKGTFQHSSFLAGGATLSAGRLVVEDGILKAVWPHSGHYLPTEENFLEFVSFLRENKVDLTNVEKSPHEGEGVLPRKDKSIYLQSKPLKEDSIGNTGGMNARDIMDKNDMSRCLDSNSAEDPKPSISRLSRGLRSKITNLQIPERNLQTLERNDVFDIFKKDTIPRSCRAHLSHSPSEDGYETAEESFLSEEEFMVPKSNLFDSDDEDSDHEPIPKEKILRRIVSHKEMKSYQLAQHLSSRWTTGAGPRIGCMRDYPQELQLRVLEQTHLSPRARVHVYPQPQSRMASSLSKGTSMSRSTLTANHQVLPLSECN